MQTVHVIRNRDVCAPPSYRCQREGIAAPSHVAVAEENVTRFNHRCARRVSDVGPSHVGGVYPQTPHM